MAIFLRPYGGQYPPKSLEGTAAEPKGADDERIRLAKF